MNSYFITRQCKWESNALLHMKIAHQYTAVFDHILNAYARIGEALPRVQQYRNIFQQPEFDHILSLIYAYILEFHRRAYKILTRRGEFNLRFLQLKAHISQLGTCSFNLSGRTLDRGSRAY